MPVQQPLPGGDIQSLTSDQAQALKIHNDARQAVGNRPNLEWDPYLEGEAQKWAQHLANDVKGLQHSNGDQRPGQGENLFWWSAGGDLASASQGWVDECKNYHGEKIGEGDFGSYGHYTQVIWSSTTKVGVASVTSSDGGNFIVGRYSPTGNFTGQSAF